MKSVENRIAWLGGIIDGEGSVSVRRKGRYLRPLVDVCNTNHAIINMVISIYEEFGIKYTLDLRRWKNPNYRDCFYIRVRSRAGVTRLLELISGLLVGKKEQAFLALQLLNKSGSESELLEHMYALNRRGVHPGTSATTDLCGVHSEGKRYVDLSGKEWYGRAVADANLETGTIYRENVEIR